MKDLPQTSEMKKAKQIAAIIKGQVDAGVRRKIADIVNENLPQLLLNFYERRDLNGGNLGRYFITEEQIALTLIEFKSKFSNFSV